MITASDIAHSLITFPVAGALITMGSRRLNVLYRIRRKGLQAKGFIYGKNGTKLVIRFVTKCEKWVTAEHAGAGVFEKGDTLQVIYNPRNPKEFFIQSFAARYVSYLLIAGGIILIIISILALLHIIPWHT